MITVRHSGCDFFFYCYRGISSEKLKPGNSLSVQWLELCASPAGRRGSLPGLRAKIPSAKKKKKKRKKETGQKCIK